MWTGWQFSTRYQNVSVTSILLLLKLPMCSTVFPIHDRSLTLFTMTIARYALDFCRKIQRWRIQFLNFRELFVILPIVNCLCQATCKNHQSASGSLRMVSKQTLHIQSGKWKCKEAKVHPNALSRNSQSCQIQVLSKNSHRHLAWY